MPGRLPTDGTTFEPVQRLAEVVVEDGDDVNPGKDHSEFEGELRGLVAGAQFAPVGGGAGLFKKEVAPLLLNAGDFVVHASRLRPYLG